MSHYRRLRTPGGRYFFTVNLADRSSDRLVRDIADLRRAVAYTRARHPFDIDAWVVLPDHLHAVWTLPDGDTDFSVRWMLIKRLFAVQQPPTEQRSPSRAARRERGIWQRRFWDHLIRNEDDFCIHIAYVHNNPVRHGLVSHPSDWPYSTIHRAAALGRIPPSRPAPAGQQFGERRV